jgi:hypothetical protein
MPMIRTLTLLLALTITAGATTLAADQPDTTDRLAQMLSEVGFTRADLGYEPKGYWNRFPLDVPYKLTSFDALFAEPLKLYDYARVMANTVELYLAPHVADTADDALYKLVYNLGVDKRLQSFRSYSANLSPAPEGDYPLIKALEGVFEYANQPVRLKSFGSVNHRFDTAEGGLRALTHLPDTVAAIIAQLLVNLTEAARWRDLAFRNCDPSDMQTAFAIRDLANTQADGQVYHPELDDIAATIDWASLYYAALKVAAAAEKAERALIPWAGKVPPEVEFELLTPLGKVILMSAYERKEKTPSKLLSQLPSQYPGWTELDASDCLLIIDFGRNTVYHGSAGATASLSNPISVVIDLDGDDYYGRDRQQYPPSAGVGLLGIGLVLDSRGDDHYNGSVCAQGMGMFGVGILYDREGNDTYRAELSAQGCGYFGIGLHFDGTGDDQYYLYGNGQGLGGVGGGVGVCASYSGNDTYTAEPYAAVYDRGDYHSNHIINGNEAQGAGFGRRGDGSDGHSWAGGLGAIIDIEGDDHYYSGNWSLGVGYWFGTGIAVDRSGDDHYQSCYFTQASGAHYCNGILLDEGGDDRHQLFETAGAGLGFGWDYANALLINKEGNDLYEAKIISMGLAQIRSVALLIDIGGDDRYLLGANTPGLGEATYREDYRLPSPLTPYYTYAASFGGLLDIGGSDEYLVFDSASTREHPVARDNHLWLQPAREDSTYGANNYGVGLDVASGTVPELFKWDR